MALMACKECGKQLSSTARSCPHCGAKVPRTKWWLWIPLALLVVVVGYGASIPEYESQARQHREICEQLAGPLRRAECQRIYELEIKVGKAQATKEEAPIDQKLKDATAKAMADDDAATLNACNTSLDEKKASYQRLMREKDYWSASLALRRCAELRNDAALQALVADAEQKQYIKEVEDRALSWEKRKEALDALLRDYPQVGRKYAELLKR